MVVRDSKGREWHVKQAPHSSSQGDEGRSVVLSRVLSASAITNRRFTTCVVSDGEIEGIEGSEPRVEQGGRFRLDVDWLRIAAVGRGSRIHSSAAASAACS
jgi:hypothetical protein